MAQVVLEDVCKTFQGRCEPVRAVRNINLAIEDKEFMVLLGPSGGGKTTTLRLIAGLETVTSGAIRFGGRVVNDLPARERNVAMVFQSDALYPHMNAFENMALGLKLRKVGRTEVERRVRETAQSLGLTHLLNRRPETLSGGERRRVALGRAMVRNPAVFLFDEPLSNLDAPLRYQLRSAFSELRTRWNATVVYVTHDQSEAMSLADRIAVMEGGIIHQVGDPMSVYERPANLFVAGFVGSPPMNLLRGEITTDSGALHFVSDKGTVDAPVKIQLSPGRSDRLEPFAGRKVIFGLRPEDISLVSDTTRKRSSNELDTVVSRVEALGAETCLLIKLGEDSMAVRIQGNFGAAVGQAVRLRFDLARAHFFDPGTNSAIVSGKNP